MHFVTSARPTIATTTTKVQNVIGFNGITDDIQVGCNTLSFVVVFSDSTKLSISTSSVEEATTREGMIHVNLITLKENTA